MNKIHLQKIVLHKILILLTISLKKKLAYLSILLMLLTVSYANLKVISYETFTSQDVSQLPIKKACLVLGTSKRLSNGNVNQFYSYRMQAAKLAYSSGKCSVLVLSGDNRKNNYNEPELMKESLLQLGIPAEHIYCDYAGGRTLDSVVRFKYIFGQNSGIVVSQAFHNARAIYIGKAHGIDLAGFNAKDPDAYNGFRTKIREILSRVRAVADVELLNSVPRHYV